MCYEGKPTGLSSKTQTHPIHLYVDLRQTDRQTHTHSQKLTHVMSFDRQTATLTARRNTHSHTHIYRHNIYLIHLQSSHQTHTHTHEHADTHTHTHRYPH